MNWQGPYKKRRWQKYQAVFGSPDGKWVLADLAGACGFGQDPYAKGDPHGTSYYVGRAFAPLHIRSIIDMSAAEMGRILKLHEEEERRAQEDPLA